MHVCRKALSSGLTLHSTLRDAVLKATLGRLHTVLYMDTIIPAAAVTATQQVLTYKRARKSLRSCAKTALQLDG